MLVNIVFFGRYEAITIMVILFKYIYQNIILNRRIPFFAISFKFFLQIMIYLKELKTTIISTCSYIYNCFYISIFILL